IVEDGCENKHNKHRPAKTKSHDANTATQAEVETSQEAIPEIQLESAEVV
ncbi:hypothetical protein A2U01_0096433, partial [Trifolium medium]|nr:hypothetical protein [Trifolium medium]